MLMGSNRPLSSCSPWERQEAFKSKDNPPAAAMPMASVTLGLARFDPMSRASLGDLMVKVDQAMYEQKRRRAKPLFELATNAPFH